MQVFSVALQWSSAEKGDNMYGSMRQEGTHTTLSFTGTVLAALALTADELVLNEDFVSCFDG